MSMDITISRTIGGAYHVSIPLVPCRLFLPQQDLDALHAALAPHVTAADVDYPYPCPVCAEECYSRLKLSREGHAALAATIAAQERDEADMCESSPLSDALEDAEAALSEHSEADRQLFVDGYMAAEGWG